MKIPLTADYADGRQDGKYVFERFGPQDADGILEFLNELDNLPLWDKGTDAPTSRTRSLYAVAYERSLNEAIGNSLS